VETLDRDALDRAIARLGAEPIDESPRIAAPLAEAHRLRGEPARAIEIARSGLASFPNHMGILCVLARSLADAGDRDGSRETYAELLSQDPGNIEARSCLGLASARSDGESDDAPAPGPVSPGIPEGLAHLEGLFSTGDRGRGSTDTESIATLTLAEIYARQGLRDKAVEVCERIVREHPDDEEARARLEEYRSAPAQII